MYWTPCRCCFPLVQMTKWALVLPPQYSYNLQTSYIITCPHLQVIMSYVSSDHLWKVISDLFCITSMCHHIAAVTWLTPPGSVRKLLTMGFSAPSRRFIFCSLFRFTLSLQMFCFFSQLCFILFLSCVPLYFFPILLRSLSSFSLCVSLSLTGCSISWCLVLPYILSLHWCWFLFFSSVLPSVLDNIVGFTWLF